MRKIAIIGTAPASRLMAPFDDPSWEIWACSPGNHGDGNLKRVTIWFELHSIAGLTGPDTQAGGAIESYLKWLRTKSFPIYMQEKNDLVPDARVFPMPVLVERFGKNWFTSTIAWLMAFAIHERVDEIAIFGVDMAADTELYSGQRAGCLRFIEFAEAAGIKVSIPWESCLGHHPPLYAYDQATPFGRRMAVLMNMAQAQRAKIDADATKLQLERAFADGAIAQMRYIQSTWLDGSDALRFLDLPYDIVAEARKYAETHAQRADHGFAMRYGDMRDWPLPSVSGPEPVASVGAPLATTGEPFRGAAIPPESVAHASTRLTPPPSIAEAAKAHRRRANGRAARV